MMSSPLVNGSSQTAAPLQFPFIVLLQHGRGTIFNLQPSSSSPRSFNFNPRHQLHPSSTSILHANFIPRRRQLQPSSLGLDIELAQLGSVWLVILTSWLGSARYF
jgi:hypothetical protein